MVRRPPCHQSFIASEHIEELQTEAPVLLKRPQLTGAAAVLPFAAVRH
jgi:hypothetical protein